jgi:hypothetical protein
MGLERRGCLIQLEGLVNQKWEEPGNKAKPFEGRIARPEPDFTPPLATGSAAGGWIRGAG